MLKNKRRLISFSLGLVAVVGIIGGAVYAASRGETEVRISTLQHEDGRVEVGLQQRDADGSWGERTLPERRFLRPDVTGRWLHSSPVTVQIADADNAMSDVAVPSDEASTELYCIVHHGADGDPFWESFNLAAAQNVADLGLTNVEIRAEPDVEQHAKAIMDCIDRDASAIASSIPSLDGLSDALAAVYQSGAFLVTFNSGADFASQLGSFVHYGLDDRAAGEIAGREFNDAGATRTILCVVHETANVGLEDRCNGLASTYGGAVEQVQLPAGSLSDLSTAGAAIGGAIAAHQAEGVLVLNGALISAAVGAADFLGSGTKLGVIGRSTEAVIFVATERILFSISDVDIGQAVHVALALKNIDASPSYRQLLTLTSSGAGATIILMKPTAFNQDSVRSLPPEWLAQVCQLVATLAPDTEYELCNQ